MPSPGMPKMVSTPHLMSVSTMMSPPVFAIVSLLAFFVNAYVAEGSPAGPGRRFAGVRRRPQDDVAGHFLDVSHASQRHGDAELVLQDLERLGDACLAVSAEAVEIGTADEAGARAEPEELQHIQPRADAAVDIDFDLVADPVHDRAEYRCGRGRAVELAPA